MQKNVTPCRESRLLDAVYSRRFLEKGEISEAFHLVGDWQRSFLAAFEG